MLKLGDTVKDIYTGFVGTAIARTEWLYGCARITIEPLELNKDGELRASQTFDEQRIVLLEEKVPYQSPSAKAETGGPQDAPQRQADPK